MVYYIMLEYNRTDISEAIDMNKTSDSHEWKFVTNGTFSNYILLISLYVAV